jgi:hypothetical protein
MDWDTLLEIPLIQLEQFFIEHNEKEVQDRRWNIKLSLLSHTPMTKEAAHSLSRELREMDREFKKITRNLRKPPIDRKAPVVSKIIETVYDPGESLDDYKPENVNAQLWTNE